MAEKSKKKQPESPIQIMKLTPIQMPHVDIAELKCGRKAFTQEECSSRVIAFALLQKFQTLYPEWFEEKKTPDGMAVTDEELGKLKPMPAMAMVASVGSNDKPDMYNYLGGVRNDKRSDELDAAFKQEKSNFRIVIVVDIMLIGKVQTEHS